MGLHPFEAVVVRQEGRLGGRCVQRGLGLEREGRPGAPSRPPSGSPGPAPVPCPSPGSDPGPRPLLDAPPRRGPDACGHRPAPRPGWGRSPGSSGVGSPAAEPAPTLAGQQGAVLQRLVAQVLRMLHDAGALAAMAALLASGEPAQGLAPSRVEERHVRRLLPGDAPGPVKGALHRPGRTATTRTASGLPPLTRAIVARSRACSPRAPTSPRPRPASRHRRRRRGRALGDGRRRGLRGLRTGRRGRGRPAARGPGRGRGRGVLQRGGLGPARPAPTPRPGAPTSTAARSSGRGGASSPAGASWSARPPRAPRWR